MTSKINDSIKKRSKSNDIFITPLPLAKTQINMIDYKEDDIWYDPFKNDGSYYKQYPNTQSINEWSEILEDKDFFTFNKKVDIICSNPPYSIMDKVIQKSIELNPRVISYLIGVNNLTARRIEMFEKEGYILTKIHICKVFKWFGMSFIVQFEKGGSPCLSFDRIVWR
tara:strand:+ start:209 stop:712 length:504 start_codon:yes stop_codon:yes gene_type:complete